MEIWGVSLASAAFWTSLTVLDPLAVVLLIGRPNMGVLATAIIIIADVIHNLWVTARYATSQRFIATAVSDPFLLSQVAFLLFVIVTVPVAWERGNGPLHSAVAKPRSAHRMDTLR